MIPDLSVDLCGVRLANPLVLASGIWGTYPKLMERVAACGAGAITAKSIGPEYRSGHRNPTVLDWGAGLINAVGLANPGMEDALPVLREAAERVRGKGAVFIASIFAHSLDDFRRVAARVVQAGPDLLEANLSCPNVMAEFGRPFALDADSAASATRAIKSEVQIPVFVKLSPNVNDIVGIARAVVDAGADGLTLINTLGPGMVIDVESAAPILSNKVGGLSGPAIRPVAVRCVYDVTRSLGVPVIGTGGVTQGRDAVEMIMAGAAAVGVGSAVYWQGPEAFCRINEELARFMIDHSYGNLNEFRSKAHEHR